jgi:hypothetical protein
MSNSTLESQANLFGIPMQITIDNDLRYSDCDAHMATLTSIEGKHAIYKGECMMGHNYEMSYEIEELKKMAHIENGEIVFGDKKDFVAGDLEEY